MSEWFEEKNQWGGVRRYCWVNGVKVYEATVNIDGVEVPESEVESYNARKKAVSEARIKAEREAAKKAPPLRVCPLSENNNSCIREKCALYLNGCTLARLTDRPSAKATEGLQCPFSRYHFKCRTDCALYRGNGCTFTGIITESED